MRRRAKQNWYETPRYYDIVFDPDTAEEADFLEATLRKHGRGRGNRVLEPACGTGRLVAELARRGYDVVGFDDSPSMLAYAKRRVRHLSVQLLRARLEEFRVLGRFDLAYCLFGSFKYLLTDRDARRHLQIVARLLRRGGIYVLGLHLTDYADTSCTRERWVGERRGTRVVCNIQGWPADAMTRRERVRSRLVVEQNGIRKRIESEWEFRTYDLRQLRRLLRSAKELEHVGTYDFHMTDEVEFRERLSDCILVLRRR